MCLPGRESSHRSYEESRRWQRRCRYDLERASLSPERPRPRTPTGLYRAFLVASGAGGDLGLMVGGGGTHGFVRIGALPTVRGAGGGVSGSLSSRGAPILPG